MKCPCCDRELEHGGAIVVSLETNHLIFNNVAVHLTPRETEIMHVLLQAMPHSIDSERIICKVWSVCEPAGASNTLSVHITKLRKKLPPDLLIRNFYGKYMMAYASTAALIDKTQQTVWRVV